MDYHEKLCILTHDYAAAYKRFYVRLASLRRKYNLPNASQHVIIRKINSLDYQNLLKLSDKVLTAEKELRDWILNT